MKAIRQVKQRLGASLWADVSESEYLMVEDDPDVETRIVYAEDVAMCPEIDQPCRRCPTLGLPCEATQPTQAEAPSERDKRLLELGYSQGWSDHKNERQHGMSAEQVRAATATQQVAWDECVASGQSCEYGAHGPDGEQQCRYCGKPRWERDVRFLFDATEARNGEHARGIYEAFMRVRTALATQQAGQVEPVGVVVEIDTGDEESGPHAWVELHCTVNLGDKLYATPPAPQQPEALAQQEREALMALFNFMQTAFVPMTPQQQEIQKQLDITAAATRAARSSEGGASNDGTR